jgi:predicted GIY-YIG superfamily endonuclease
MNDLAEIVELEIPLRWQAPTEDLQRHIEDAFPEPTYIKEKLRPSADYGLLATIISEVFDDLDFESVPYFVYVLECSVPPEERAKEMSEKISDDETTPEWLDRIHEVREVFYVGQTNNIYRRLWEHIGDLDRGAQFTAICKPIKLRRLETCKTREEAEAREKELRRRINEIGGKGSQRAFAYSDRKSEEPDWNDELLGRVLQKHHEEYLDSETPPQVDMEQRMREMNEMFWDDEHKPE